MADIDLSPFGMSPTASFAVAGKSVAFPIERLREEGGNRIVRHRRLYRPGARCDDLSANEVVWEITTSFYNSDEHEGGIEGEIQYPDKLNELIDLFAEHEVGTLTLPTRGDVRARAEGWERVEEAEHRNMAAVRLLFVEDNEDDETVAAWQAPSAASVVSSTASDFTSAASAAGAYSEAVGDLQDMANDLEALATAPGDYLGDLEETADELSAACQDIEDTFTNLANAEDNELAELLRSPEQSFALRQLRKTNDAAQQAKADAVHRRQTIAKTYQRHLSIFEVAADVGQDGSDLMGLNPTLPDQLNIEPNTPVLVYAD